MEGSEREESIQNVEFHGEAPIVRDNLFLDHVGEVTLAHSSYGLSWKLLDSLDDDGSSCLGIKFVPQATTEIIFSDVYAVELFDYGLMHGSNLSNSRTCFLGSGSYDSEMYRFTVHGMQRSTTHPCLWVLATYTFGHKDLHTCETWVNRINASLNRETGRPKNLLVFVNPMSGRSRGCKTWETVAPIFLSAKVKTKVIVTERAGHAFDALVSATNEELSSYDGVIAVGGDGFFNEILNGFLSTRHKAPLPPAPSDNAHSVQKSGRSPIPDQDETTSETHQNEGHPLLQCSSQYGAVHTDSNQDVYHPLDNEQFRFGLIPAGSTDTIVMCTTGARDPITSALHIVLGKRICIDVAQVVRWKITSTSQVEPYVRYATSFAGYGFYGDVITESEKWRWMGPKRYDFAGTKVFLRHRSYEAEVAYLDVEPEVVNSTPDGSRMFGRIWTLSAQNKSEKAVCRANCAICRRNRAHTEQSPCATPCSQPDEARWLKSRGRFLSVGAAIISNRNERAPDGLVADAHLSDGFLHLILLKDCSHAMYLWHLTQIAKKGGEPLNFDFVEYHKTTAFTFTSFGKPSVWNLDGELFEANQLSAQVLRGLVSLFASGPEV